jgi:hypothetical protein
MTASPINLCGYCRRQALPAHMDHVVPISRGGPDDPTNKVLSCAACNLSKGARLPSEWLENPPPLIAEIERNVLLRCGNRDPRVKDRQPIQAAAPIGAAPLPSVAAVLEWKLGLSLAELRPALDCLYSALGSTRTVMGIAAQNMLRLCSNQVERQFLLGLFCRKDEAYTIQHSESPLWTLFCEHDGFRFRVTRGFNVLDDAWECDCDASEDDDGCGHGAPTLGDFAFVLHSESLDGSDIDLKDMCAGVGIDLCQQKRTAAQCRAMASAAGEYYSILRFDAHEVATAPAVCFDEAVAELRALHYRAERMYRAGYRLGYEARGRAIEVVPEAAE